MSTFWLKIVASDHIFYNGNCETLVVPAHDGEMGILPHHEAMILAVQEGELRFRVPGETQWRGAIVGRGNGQGANNRGSTFSFTHITLPTSALGEELGGGRSLKKKKNNKIVYAQ